MLLIAFSSTGLAISAEGERPANAAHFKTICFDGIITHI
tara:strand:- start:354 stop:470 length:117 start_codon:yes stop_codon:yes gene_type:complete